MYGEIYLKESYKFRAERRDPLIVDAGANIGLATTYFKKLYPASRVYSYEPDPAAYNALQRNVAGLPDVNPVNCALSLASGNVDFYTGGRTHMSLLPDRKTNHKKITVQSKRLSEELKRICTGERLDLLKLDVEGGEHEILRDLRDTEMIDMVDQMIIEYHHHLGGRDNLAGFLGTLENNGFGYSVSGNRKDDPRSFSDIFIRAYRTQ